MPPKSDDEKHDLQVAREMGRIATQVEGLNRRLDAQYEEYRDYRKNTEIYMRDGCKLAQETAHDVAEMKRKGLKIVGAFAVAILSAEHGLDWLRSLLLK